ncbi:MAG: hypothetical protein OXE17_05000 [Chloroflexi bacterium]|nr:hypothetical protein [Chloroflexota bacterium]
MALSISTYVFLALAGVLLVTGSVVTVRYLVDPVPQDETVSAPVSAAVPAPAPAVQSRPETGPTRITVRPSPLPTPVQVAATPLPPATPNVVTASLSNEPPGSNTGAGAGETGSPETSATTGAVEPGIPVPVAGAVAPLGENFVVAWHYIETTDDFVFYDPKLPEESTLKAMASGQTYLIMVDESVTVVINGKELHFVCDENTCWNTVVWP